MTQREELLMARLREATAALQRTLDERDALIREKNEPIAIIGMGCRFPGGAESPAAFWELLSAGRDAIQPLDARWALVGAGPAENAPRWAGLLTGAVDGFDAGFFGISPREALTLDPQHRLLLEVAWEALEDAGICPPALQGSRTGVYIGATNTDYADILAKRPREEQDAYTVTGNLLSVAAGRLSYTFGLQGPCLTVDTTCSSSLVAVHLACRSLRARESELALAGGVNLLLSPDTMDGIQRMQALSPEGRCKTFDALANGFARGEGCGMLVLKRVSDAKRDGDRIWALIRGSAVNQDGKSTGLTAPNVLSQEALLREALREARLEAGEIGYIETHGTGTSLGDPIEVEALRRVMGPERADGSACVLGAVKTNIGHLEAAAGVAGLMKAVLTLHHERIVANLHCRSVNPRLRLEGTALKLANGGMEWRRGERVRYAGVSAFGMSGTNAHVVLEEGPKEEAKEAAEEGASERGAEVVVLSARSEEALVDAARRLKEHLEVRGEVRLRDVAWSLGRTRSEFKHRLSVVVRTREELVEKLCELGKGETPPGAYRGVVRGGGKKVAFMMAGQGSQQVGMGRELHRAYPAFRAALDRCAKLFEAELERPLLEVMWGEAGSEAAKLLDQTAYTQAALFTLEMALYEQWRAWGVEPEVLAGHSIGEVAAACAAGVFTLEDGVKLVGARGRLMQRLPGAWGMVSIEAGEAEVAAVVAGAGKGVTIAAVNGPQQVVIAGEKEAVEGIGLEFMGMGKRSKVLRVSHGFHSAQMEGMQEGLRVVAEGLEYRRAGKALVSGVSGKLDGGEMSTAEYWVRQVREAVRYGGSIETMVGLGVGTYIELGATAGLLGLVGGQVPEGKAVLVASQRSGREGERTLLEGVGVAWVSGIKVDWSGVFADGGVRVPLPSYPWQRRKYWCEIPRATAQLPTAVPVTIGEYYDSVAQADAVVQGGSDGKIAERYLTFAAFPQVIPGFSWLLATATPDAGKEHTELVLTAQRQMRAVLFRHVDFPSCVNVLDFGCGYATDLIVLAQRHAHLSLHGYTISAEQASLGLRRARQAGVEDRVAIYHRDSAKSAFLTSYDLIFGIEVACHIRDKRALFANVGEHLREGRLLVLADFVSNAQFDIEHEEASSFLATRDRWADVLAQGGLRIVDCVDVSQQIANFLYDPAFDENLERVKRYSRDAGVSAAFKSYDQLGKLLLRKLASYVLLTACKEAAPEEELRRLNRRALDEMVPYETLGGGGRENDDPFLEIAWEPALAPAARGSSGRWLLIGEGGGLGLRLRTALEASGHAAVHTPSTAELGVLLRTAFGGQPPTGVVHLGSLDGGGPLDAAAIEAALVRGCDSVLSTVQSLSSMGFRDAPRLWIITRGAQAASASEVSLAQSPLLGLGRVIAMEHAELRCARLDLDPGRPASGEELTALVAELLADDAEDEVALRGGSRLVARLVHRPPAPVAPRAAIRKGGAYLVTGGLGGLGLSVAGWLAEQGALHLVLLGRSGVVTAEQRAAVAALEAKGCRVTIARADVAERSELEAVLRAIAAAGTPLCGVVHAAGLADPGMLKTLTPERLRKVLAPKVLGALHLHELTRGANLDFFVMYGSVAGLLGLGGTGSYAAANVFLDALAHHRRALGLPGLSIDWGPFAEVGMAAGRDRRQADVFFRGMQTMSLEQGLAALTRLLDGNCAQVGVVPLNVRQWVELYPAAASSRRLSRLLAAQRAEERTGAGDRDLRARLVAAEPRTRQKLMLSAVRALVSYVLRIDEGEIDFETPFTSMGMDSLMGLELRNRIEVKLGIKVPATLLWTFPSVAALSEHLLSEVCSADLKEQPRTAPKSESEAESETLSADESARLIDEAFEAIS